METQEQPAQKAAADNQNRPQKKWFGFFCGRLFVDYLGGILQQFLCCRLTPVLRALAAMRFVVLRRREGLKIRSR